MAKSSAVHTPRNVDLPTHVIRPKNVSTKKSDSRRKRCLCLSCWVLGLVLLCAGVVVIAHFLLPAFGQTSDSNMMSDAGQSVELVSENVCVDRNRDIYPLDQKLQMSETIVVGTVEQNSIHVARILKESPNSDKKVEKIVRLDPFQESCHLDTNSRQMFFLSAPIFSNKNSSKDSDKLRPSPEVYRPRFRSMLTTPKLVQIVVRILSNDFFDETGRQSDTSVDEIARQQLKAEPVTDSESLKGKETLRINFRAAVVAHW